MPAQRATGSAVEDLVQRMFGGSADELVMSLITRPVFLSSNSGIAFSEITLGLLVNLWRQLRMPADLRRLVLSPVISAEDQAKALGAVLEKAGISGLTANFAKLIAKNRRLFAAADMMKAFRALVARERGEVSADVASAHALTPEQMQLLSDTLRTSIGKNVRIDTRVDPSLLGGLVVKIGSRMIDSSLRTKLNNLKVVMKGIG